MPKPKITDRMKVVLDALAAGSSVNATHDYWVIPAGEWTPEKVWQNTIDAMLQRGLIESNGSCGYQLSAKGREVWGQI